MDYTFDVNKAYHYLREALITGAQCKIEVIPDNIVKVHTYIKPIAEDEEGMKDAGADIYFEGIKEGTAAVTVTVYYPTWENEIYDFNLSVDADLVTTILN